MRILTLFFTFLSTAALAEPLRVVTDIPPVYSLVTQVMGERGTATVLLGPDAEPHQFQLRPSQSRDIASADLLIWISPDLTPWLARAKEGIASDVPSLVLFAGEGRDGAQTLDPHIWLDPAQSARMVQDIAERLSGLDPEGRANYAANAAEALSGLVDTQTRIAAQLAGVADQPFVVGHDGYSHFVTAFGLNQVGSLSDLNDNPASAKQVSNLARLAADGGIACIFPEVGESDKLAAVIVDQGAELGAALDPIGVTLELGVDLHANLLRQLANDLETCLSP
jgi:zinc transport system substrate-binding protein